MKCLLANRIDFYVFPCRINVKLSCCVMGCVTSGHVRRGHGAKSKDVPSRGMYYYYTIDYHRVIQFFDELRGRTFFPSHPSHFVLSAVLGVVVAVSFLSALTFTGLEKYLFLIFVNYL